MNKFEVLVSLNMAGEIGKIRLSRLLEYFTKPEEIFSASTEKLIAVTGITENLASRIHSFKQESLAKELKKTEKLGLKVITLDDPDYPENLKNIYSPPIVLYVLGELKPEYKQAVAIVGSRRASLYGLSCAEKFACELAGCDWVVVSGMARGIDTAAHKGALKAGGRTIAVIGSGFNHIYPEENSALAGTISKNGAVISEFPLDTRPLRENFPRRNRIISGLSLGVLVVEAAKNSGALITADFALEQGREVFCLPGRIDSRSAFGTNELIKQGAKLVTNTSEVMEEFSGRLTKRQEDPLPQKDRFKLELSDQEDDFCSLISDKLVHIDSLIDETKLDIVRVSDILLSLRLKKIIRELPGKYYVRVI